jgi:hypothetical protein
MMKVLSLIPPMTQLNTPYPSTAYLTGFLRSRGVDAVQEDLALALVLSFFTPEGMSEIRAQALTVPEESRSASVNFFLDYFDAYQSTIAPTISFLQGRDSTLSHRINTRDFLPEGPRFTSLDAFDEEEAGDPLSWAFGALGSQDRARHLATLYLNDLSDVLRDAVDDRFEFVRYAESLASSQPTFTPLADALQAKPTLMDLHLQELASKAIERHQPNVVLLSVPFPGAMYAALRIAQVIKKSHPEIKIALGGGYVNTELRELSDARIFDYVDFITLDSGERPLLALLEHIGGKRSTERLVRTFMRNSSNQVQYLNWQELDVPQCQLHRQNH